MVKKLKVWMRYRTRKTLYRKQFDHSLGTHLLSVQWDSSVTVFSQYKQGEY